MFRKLVSSLPYSPALVGQLGFYARRLSKEQSKRRLGLIFTALAVVVQSFAILSPPEPTYASSVLSGCVYNSALTKNDSECQACPYNSAIWYKDASCNKNVKLSIEAINLSQDSKPAASVTANTSERIQYTIRTTNNGPRTTVAVELPISDLMEYATVIDTGGGMLDETAHKITWGNIVVDNKQTDIRSFVVLLNANFAMTPQAVDDPSSYDCILATAYGNQLNIPLSCPAGKQIEGTIKQLPETSAGTNIVFSLVVLGIVAYLYARSRLMNREIKIIRRDYNVG